MDLIVRHLPDGQIDPEGFKANLLSPQIQQGMEALDRAVMSEQWDNILLSLGLHDDDSIKNAEDRTLLINILALEALIKAAIKKFGN